MDIEQILEQSDKELEDLIGVTLPRSSWMLILSLMMVPIIQDINEIKQEPWRDTDELEEALGEPILKLIPTLLEAAGPGPQNIEDFPDIQMVRQNAEMIWEQYGEKPSEENWDTARQATINLFNLLREQGLDPDEVGEFKVTIEEA